ncbi:MAG: hypothetical protein IKA70_00020 [Alistipes sp.]|nr:hypothetical protein [Alistipes sp.]
MKNSARKRYLEPQLEVEEMLGERGFSLSSNYGDYGEAGQKSDYIDSDFEL